MDDLKKEVFDFVFAVYRVTDLIKSDEVVRRQLRELAGDMLSKTARYLVPGSGIGATEYITLSGYFEAIRSLIELADRAGLMKSINARILIRESASMMVYFELESRNMATSSKNKLNTQKLQGVKNDIHLDGQLLDKRHLETIAIKQGVINDTAELGHEILETNSIELCEHATVINTFFDSENSKGPAVGGAYVADNNNYDVGSGSERQAAIINYLAINKEAKINDLATIFSNRFSLKTLQRDLARLILERKVERQGDKRWAVYRLVSL